MIQFDLHGVIEALNPDYRNCQGGSLDRIMIEFLVLDKELAAGWP